MKKFEKIKIIFLTTLLLIGCNWSKQAPRCSDERVQATVIKIVRGEMSKKLQQFKAEATLPIPTLEAEMVAAMERLKLDAIRTRSVDKDKCQCECAAELLINPEQPTPITYIVEKADNGEPYVTVYGL